MADLQTLVDDLSKLTVLELQMKQEGHQGV